MSSERLATSVKIALENGNSIELNQRMLCDLVSITVKAKSAWTDTRYTPERGTEIFFDRDGILFTRSLSEKNRLFPHLTSDGQWIRRVKHGGDTAVLKVPTEIDWPEPELSSASDENT